MSEGSGLVSNVHCFDPYNDFCPFCLDELRRGIPENGICGHEAALNEFPHLRFNAIDRHSEAELRDSAARAALAKAGVTK